MCLNPRTIRLKDGRNIKVGCGHCLQCLKQYQDQWTARLSEEAKSWKVGPDGFLPIIFFTLKYRNDTVPCTYLVITERGMFLTETKPDYCEVVPFWTDTTLNRRLGPWLSRPGGRLDVLKRFASDFNRIAADLAYDLDATPEDIRNKDYIVENVEIPDSRYYLGVHNVKRYVKASSLDIPEYLDFEPLNGVHSLLFGKLPVSKQDMPLWHDSALYALEFHSVQKCDVQDWVKRGRMRFERAHSDWFADTDSFNPRFNPFWTDSDGVERKLPDCAIPKTLKYFYTSEYGPSTHRPHGHGVMFGVTYDEFQEFFAKDWEDNFGTIDVSVYDPNRGAFSYISKYCSKGGYEHPYCATDFFYADGSEYHSRRYENCITDFGCPYPLVRPTFHLISKGLGVRYAFDAEIQRYFGTVLSEYLTDSGRRKYSCSDAPEALHAHVLPSLSLADAAFTECSSVIDTELLDNGDIRIRKYDYHKGLVDNPDYPEMSPDPVIETLLKDRLIGESIVKADAVVSAAIEDLLFNKKYNRTYVRSYATADGPQGRQIPLRCVSCWHKLGHYPSVFLKPTTTSITLPRYYRQWLVSPLAQALRCCSAVRKYPDLDAAIARIMESDRPEDEKVAAVQSLQVGAQMQQEVTTSRLRRSAQRFYLTPYGNEFLD